VVRWLRGVHNLFPVAKLQFLGHQNSQRFSCRPKPVAHICGTTSKSLISTGFGNPEDRTKNPEHSPWAQCRRTWPPWGQDPVGCHRSSVGCSRSTPEPVAPGHLGAGGAAGVWRGPATSPAPRTSDSRRTGAARGGGQRPSVGCNKNKYTNKTYAKYIIISPLKRKSGAKPAPYCSCRYA